MRQNQCIVKILSWWKRGLSLLAVVSFVCPPVTHFLCAQSDSQPQVTILAPEEINKTMPATVFFRGQSAPVQLRNTSGLRFPGGGLMLAALVDTAGYSSGLKEKYQGYLLSETPLTIGGQSLPAGAYGFGFLANNRFVVMDIGGHDVLRATYRKDAALARPRPLTILPGKMPGSSRLYEGRNFVSIRMK